MSSAHALQAIRAANVGSRRAPDEKPVALPAW